MKPHMRIAVVETPDGEVLVRNVPLPVLKPGHVLVRVMASALNPLDTKIRAGRADHAQHPFPAVLGMDMSGVVVDAADDVTDVKIDDAVYGLVGGVGGLQGTLAEFVVVDASLLARKPERLSFREAAALPLASITAWEGLIDRAAVAAGDRVLVQGGAGAVGEIVVQLAVAKGARVMANVSRGDFDYVETLGATPMDYSAVNENDVTHFTDGAGFDIVYDTVGGTVLDASFQRVRLYSGRVVSCLGWGTHRLAPLSMRGASYSGVFTLLPLLTGEGRRHHGDILREVAHIADAGRLRARIDPRVLRLDDATVGYADLAAGRNAGKLVIEI